MKHGAKGKGKRLNLGRGLGKRVEGGEEGIPGRGSSLCRDLEAHTLGCPASSRTWCHGGQGGGQAEIGCEGHCDPAQFTLCPECWNVLRP